MSDESLAIYLRDHLAGARAAVELLDRLRSEADDRAVQHLAGSLLSEVEADRALLQRLADELGVGTSPLREAAAWLGEKLSRLKLGGDSGERGGLPLLEALEALGLGILGKLALWEALGAASELDRRLEGFDFVTLAARAREQHARVERRRLELARRALPLSVGKT